jgi:hypothetical protein
MARAGEPVTTSQAWLGHGDLKTTQRYMHYAPAADEAERVERAFAISPDDGLVSPTSRALGGGDASERRRGQQVPSSVMSEPRDDPIGPLIRELDEASRTLSKMQPLTPPQAARIAARIDRLVAAGEGQPARR